jgi:hypothetical protein
MLFYLRILCGLVFSLSLFGGSITSVSSYQLRAQALGFGLPLTFASPDSPFSIANTPTAGFSFGGDVFLLAGGQPLEVGQPIAGPLELRFSNATIACVSKTACQGTFLIVADLILGGVDSNGPFLPVFGGLEGTSRGANPGFMSYNMSVDRGVEVSTMAAANLSIDPVFSYLDQGVDIKYATNMSMSMRLTIGTMNGNSSISLPDSLFLGLGDAASPVPEPATLLILGGSLAGLAWFRKRV